MMTPFLVALLDVTVLREKLKPFTVPALILSLIGTVLMTIGDPFHLGVDFVLSANDWLGISLAFASAFFLSLYMVLIRRSVKTNVPPESLLLMQTVSLVVILGAILMLVILNYFVNATKIGTAIRAVAQDRATASLMGIDVNQIIVLTFFIGGAMGGAAGVLFGLQYNTINPFTGFIPGLKAFTAAVLGGIGNISGAMLGGIVLGIMEAYGASYLSLFTSGAFGAEYKDILAFSILIIILIFRPAGLLGQVVREKA